MATGRQIGHSMGMRAGSFLLTVPVAVAACMSSRERFELTFRQILTVGERP